MTAPSIASRIYLTDSSNEKVTRSYLIFFITGNPGLVEYYRAFLTHLHSLLNSQTTDSISFHVFGRSLSGFENNEEESKGAPFSLQEQIAQSHAALEDIVNQVQKEQKVEDVRVILIGHSVGSYILLEILRRAREKARETSARHFRVLGGVCLFPTVTHIAKSASGRKATVCYMSACARRPRERVADDAQPFLTLPFFVSFATILAKAITMLLPFSIVYFIVRRIMGFPSDAARVTATFGEYSFRESSCISHDLATTPTFTVILSRRLPIRKGSSDPAIGSFNIFSPPTSSFALTIYSVLLCTTDLCFPSAVKSPRGVHEALYMARDEMLQITTDNWDAEIWGAARPSSSSSHPPPILRFLFAKEDHWVANETRDALIQARGKKAGDNTEQWRPVMEVDEREGWPHGFCIRHSVPVAERVGKYISEMVEADTG